MIRQRVHLWESVPCFYCVDPRNRSVIVRLGSKNLYPQCHATGHLRVPFATLLHSELPAIHKLCGEHTKKPSNLTEAS